MLCLGSALLTVAVAQDNTRCSILAPTRSNVLDSHWMANTDALWMLEHRIISKIQNFVEFIETVKRFWYILFAKSLYIIYLSWGQIYIPRIWTSYLEKFFLCFAKHNIIHNSCLSLVARIYFFFVTFIMSDKKSYVCKIGRLMARKLA